MARIQIDGYVDDWNDIPVLATDASGNSPHDFLSVKAVRDEWNLIILVECAEPFLMQQDNALRLVMDADADVETGFPQYGLGAELIWTFGSRSGHAYYPNGNSMSLDHEDVALRHLPSHSSTHFEIALDLAANPLGSLLFSTNQPRFLFYEASGDRIPDSGYMEMDLGDTGLPPLEAPTLDRPAESLRLLSWNTEFGGLFDGSVSSQYQRILRATDPDLIVFSELWDESASDVVSRLGVLTPELGPWEAVKRDAGNVIASRHPIRQSWLVQSGYRETAVLIDASSVTGDSLLLIACHLRCCSANTERQEEADGLVEFIKDAREPAGRLALPPNTPILLAGDFNLVGDGQQLWTILHGDIQDNNSYGPDSPPDWDGSSLLDASPRHTQSSDCFTWHDTGSSYSPGRLDFVMYTGSVIEETGSGVLWTAGMDASLLSAWNLQSNDASAAADHIPVWFDFRTRTNEIINPAIQITVATGPQLLLNWDAVPGASSYRIEYSFSPWSGWLPLSTQPGTSFLFLYPQPDSAGYFRVTALFDQVQIR